MTYPQRLTSTYLQRVHDFFANNPDRWGQGTFYDAASDKFCVLGRLRIELRSDISYDRLPKHMGDEINRISVLALSDTVPGAIPRDVRNSMLDIFGQVAGYNDRCTTTVDEILAWLRNTIQTLQHQEELEAIPALFPATARQTVENKGVNNENLASVDQR